jgi:prenyltransferase beta subunit
MDIENLTSPVGRALARRLRARRAEARPGSESRDVHIKSFLQHAVFSALLLSIIPTVITKAEAPKSDTTPAGVSAHANQVRGDEITPRQQLAVDAGLKWLAEHQGADGSFRGSNGKHSGVTALAAISMMEAGNLPGRGKYGENVSRALRFVLSSCQESGLIVAEDSQSPMYGHGFATLFLGEVYGMTGDDSVKEKLQKAISLIERSQSTQPGNEGGWRYQPVPYDADISVTICQVMALRAARDAGIFIEPSVMDKAIKYVQECQNPDGGFSYMARSGGGTGSGFGRSAAGVASLYYAGHFQGNDLDRGLKYLKQYNPGRSARGGAPDMMEMEGQYYYGNYYSVQAMFLAGGDYWADWYPGIREQLIARQNNGAGNWTGEVTDDYCTSMALIILQMPNRYLPVFNGKGPGD